VADRGVVAVTPRSPPGGPADQPSSRTGVGVVVPDDRYGPGQNGKGCVTIPLMDVFAALADPVRRQILRQLSQGPARVVDVAARPPISRPAVSRHLRLLSQAGLVHGRDQGRERYYRLDPEPLAAVRDLLAELRAPGAGARRPPPVEESTLDALHTEVRRTVRDRRDRRSTATHTTEESA